MELDELHGSHADVGVAGDGLHDRARRWCVPVCCGDFGFDHAVFGRYAPDVPLRHELERLEVTSGDADLLVADYLHVGDGASLGPGDFELPFVSEAPLLADLQREAQRFRVRILVPGRLKDVQLRGQRQRLPIFRASIREGVTDVTTQARLGSVDAMP